MICSFNFLIFLAVCLNISPLINIKILTNSNQQTQSYEFTSHIAAFLSVVLITEMLEICKQTSYDPNVQLILKSYLPVVYGTTLKLAFSTSLLGWNEEKETDVHGVIIMCLSRSTCLLNRWPSTIKIHFSVLHWLST